MRSNHRNDLQAAAVLGVGLLAACAPGQLFGPRGCDLCPQPLATQPATLAFAAAAVGQTQTLGLQVENGTGETFHLVGIEFDGGTDFQLDGGLPALLPPGGTLPIAINFTPSAAGTRSATATIQNDSTTPALQIALSGEGVAKGWICPSPAFLDAGSVPVGASATLQLDFQACGSSATQLADVSVAVPANGFAVSGPALGSIAAGQSETWNVTFTPTAVGSVSTDIAYLLCASCAPSVEIPVFGTGTAGLVFSPDPVDFGTFPAGTSRSIVVTATNAEPTPLTLLTLPLYSRGDPAFTLQALPSLPATLAPGASLTFTVVDSPTNANGEMKNEVLATYTVGSSSTVLENDLLLLGGGN